MSFLLYNVLFSVRSKQGTYQLLFEIIQSI